MNFTKSDRDGLAVEAAPRSLSNEVGRTNDLATALHENAMRLENLVDKLFGGHPSGTMPAPPAAGAKAGNPPPVIQSVVQSNGALEDLLMRLQMLGSRIAEHVHN